MAVVIFYLLLLLVLDAINIFFAITSILIAAVLGNSGTSTTDIRIYDISNVSFIWILTIYPVLYYYTRSTENSDAGRSSIYKYTIILDIIRYIRTILSIITTHPSPITANTKENRHIICTSLYNTS